jgi:hypothetical protein
MCGKIKAGNSLVEPGAGLVIHYNGGTDYKKWGPQPYNAKLENLNGYWKTFNRGYIKVDGFYEKDSLFVLPTNEPLNLAIIYNIHGFAIVTMSSKGTIVEKVHHRTAVILFKPEYFLNRKNIWGGDYSRLIQVA